MLEELKKTRQIREKKQRRPEGEQQVIPGSKANKEEKSARCCCTPITFKESTHVEFC